MIRIAHTGDLHVSEGQRLEDARTALAFIAEDASSKGAQLFLIGGDLAGQASPHRATPAERLVLADFLQACARTAPVVCIRGNHDVSECIQIYGRLSSHHPIHVVNHPAAIDVAGARVYCLPYPSKAWGVGSGALAGGIADQKEGAEANLRAILDAWRLDAEEHRAKGVPTIGLLHLNIGGSVVGGGEVLIGRELELAPHDLVELGFDAGCLSHIHKAQMMAERWWYAGSPFAQNHGEARDPKSYSVIDVEAGGTYSLTQVPTPSRRLLTARVQWAQKADGTWAWAEVDVPPDADLQNADVRLIVECAEDGAATCPLEELEKAHLDGGATSVRIERRILPRTRVRSEAIASAVTIEDQLRAFWDSLGTSGPDEEQRQRCLALLPELHVEPGSIEEVAA